jgi:peptidoglycan DL-endopeptidase CwlO
MTYVERSGRFSTASSASRRGSTFSSILVTVGFVLGLVTAPATAGATTISQEKAEAAVLYNQIQSMTAQTQLLGQKYDLAHVRLVKILNEIANTKQVVKQIESQVSAGKKQLAADAIFAYVTNGAAASTSPLFATNANNVGATNLYNNLAQGNIGAAINSLNNQRLTLTSEKALLRAEVGRAEEQNHIAAEAYQKAAGLQNKLQRSLNAVKGQIASYYAAIAAAAAAKAAAKLAAEEAAHPTNGFVPGPDPQADVAIHEAETFLGTWYCWGGASRSCVDCSGLIMLAYQAAGIYFPHYSGAMYQETQRVPLWDIKPGDLLFYGYNGDEHVAMYVGHGNMIEAASTGTQVHITPIRLGYGFWGLGRPRA